MNGVEHSVKCYCESVKDPLVPILDSPSLRAKARGWVPLLFAVAFLALTGCQSGHHASPPPSPQHHQPIAAPDQPQKVITPAQWKAEADRWIGVNYRKGGT